MVLLLLFTGLEVLELPRSAAVAGRPVELVANMKGLSASNMEAIGILQFQTGIYTVKSKSEIKKVSR